VCEDVRVCKEAIVDSISHFHGGVFAFVCGSRNPSRSTILTLKSGGNGMWADVR